MTEPEKQDLMRRAEKEMRVAARQRPLEISLGAYEAFCIVAQLQLALRAPDNVARPAQIARKMIDGLIAQFRLHNFSALAEFAELGDRPEYDAQRKE